LDPPMHEFLPSEHQLEDEIKALNLYKVMIQGQQVALDTLGAQALLPAPFNHLNEELINKAIAKKELMLKKVKELYEVNPMLGHRGVRLGMSYPEIYQMQIRSILEAAALCAKQGTVIFPEIMVPQVITSIKFNRKLKVSMALP
jgi:pyruvate,orthophosphate dikinase